MMAGELLIREDIPAIEQMDIPHSEKKKVFEKNAKDLFGLSI